MTDDEAEARGPEEAPQADDQVDEESSGISRRALLGGTGAALGLGVGGYFLLDSGSDRQQLFQSQQSLPIPPFGVWEALQTAIQQSPDNLPATADRLVDEGDPQAIFEFARDEVGLQPPALDGNDGFDARADGGPRAILRGGMATPRETADLLAALLERAGYEAEVRSYGRSLSEQRLRDLYFGGSDHAFDPDVTEEQLDEWGRLMGDSEHSPDEIRIVDEDGTESTSLGEQVTGALPEDADRAAPDFAWAMDGTVPVVRFREASGEDEGTTGATASWQYADLFHADEEFGSLSAPSELTEAPGRDAETVTPITDDQTVDAYYGYDTEESYASYIQDDIERKAETVTFLYRNESSGRLSLVTINDHPTESEGGQAQISFGGAGNYGWLVMDGETNRPDKDAYQTVSEGSSDALRATWGWDSGYTDGGALGTLNMPFDIEMTHHAEWQDGQSQREGLNRWVFYDGDNPEDPFEIATIDEDTGDVTARVYTELVSEGETTRETITADDVASFSVTASADSYPEIRVRVDARNDAGNPVAEIPAGAVTVREDDELVAAEFVPVEEEASGDEADGDGSDDSQTQSATHALSYRTPNREETSGERSVSVDIAGSDTESTSYEVPDEALDPRVERGLCGLYLRVDVGDRTSRRTLAGWDPDIDSDRDPTESDHAEVFSALWGSYTLSFESAGIPHAVRLDDEIGGKRSLEAVYDARQSGDVEAAKEKARDGHGLVSQLPHQYQGRLPERITDGSLTYSTGLRTVLTGASPVFGEGVELREVDVLSTSGTRTLRADGDRQREFQQTVERTARRSVMERENFETSTASLLAGATLSPADEATSEMSESVRGRLETATSRRPIADDDYRLTAASGETAAFWHVDADTGELVGVLPDGSGGGSGEQILETLEDVQQAMAFAETAAAVASFGPPSPEGKVAKFYGNHLAKLYAVATVSIATISTEEYNNAVKQAISKRVCNIADTITESAFFQKSQTSGLAGFMNNLHGAKDHTSSTCLRNDVS